MKRRLVQPESTASEAERQLCRAVAVLQDDDEVRSFFRDLCTPAELEALVDRWRVVPLLLEGAPYREIHDRTGVSVTTIGRVARFLQQGHGGYRAAAERLGLPVSAEHDHHADR
jgi:TrpR-related protein YerC/YecD